MLISKITQKPVPIPEAAWRIWPGCGTNLAAVLASEEVTEAHVKPLGFGGTSGGGVCALARAAGHISLAALTDILGGMLKNPKLLDKGWLFDKSPGFFKGDKIAGFLQDVLGQRRMGDLKFPARVCAWDAWTRQPVVIDSQVHADVLAWKAGRATMAIQFVFDLVRIRENNARLYGDGGLMVNVPYGLWDDKPGAVIGVRFDTQPRTFNVTDLIAAGHGNTGDVQPVRNWGDLGPAIAKSSLNLASSSWPSEKQYKDEFREIVIKTNEDGMDFSLTDEQIKNRQRDGRLCSAAAFRSWSA